VALVKASRELKCKDLLVITWDYEDETNMEVAFGVSEKCYTLMLLNYS